MTSRERVKAAAKRKPVDKIPLMLWLEPHTTLKLATGPMPPRNPLYRGVFDGLRLLSDNLPSKELRNGAPLLAYAVQADYQRELGADIVDFHFCIYPLMVKNFTLNRDGFSVTDIYGVTRGMGGMYLESTGHPCETKEALDQYVFPDLSNPLRYSHIAAYRAMHPDAAIAVMCPGVQDWSQQWHKMEKLYGGMILYPDTIERFFRKMAEHTLQIIRGVLRAGADIVLIGDDYGTHNSMLMSKKMWERFTFPCLKMQCEEIHRHGGIAMLHSCGFVMPLLDKIVEAGVDMLHPLQQTAGNDLSAAKAAYGDRLTFVTGLDVMTLSTAGPEEVRESILAAARAAAPGGGFVLCTTNYLQVDTPLENIDVMFNTIKDIQNGRF